MLHFVLGLWAGLDHRTIHQSHLPRQRKLFVLVFFSFLCICKPLAVCFIPKLPWDYEARHCKLEGIGMRYGRGSPPAPFRPYRSYTFEFRERIFVWPQKKRLATSSAMCLLLVWLFAQQLQCLFCSLLDKRVVIRLNTLQYKRNSDIIYWKKVGGCLTALRIEAEKSLNFGSLQSWQFYDLLSLLILIPV